MIPLSVPNLCGNEWKYIKDCLDTNWVSSVGSYVDRFEQMTAEFSGCKYAVAAVNGTAALQISLELSGVKPGDHVIVPNITFVASCNSIVHAGAEPILVDVDKDTWQMDVNILSAFMKTETETRGRETILKRTGKRIKAIMPVHVLGNIGDIESVLEIARVYNLEVIEDATEALGSYKGGRHAGSFGRVGCFSFNGNKIITTGGGGMIVTNDADLAKRAKHLTTQAKADPFEYYHDENGYNFRLVNILAAMGVAQMELLPSFLERKKQIAHFYTSRLESAGAGIQSVHADVQPNNWLYTIAVQDKKRLLESLSQQKIQARPFWVPMNQLPMHRHLSYWQHNDVSSDIYNTCVSLPCSTNISDEELQRVADVVVETIS